MLLSFFPSHSPKLTAIPDGQSAAWLKNCKIFAHETLESGPSKGDPLNTDMCVCWAQYLLSAGFGPRSELNRPEFDRVLPVTRYPTRGTFFFGGESLEVAQGTNILVNYLAFFVRGCIWVCLQVPIFDFVWAGQTHSTSNFEKDNNKKHLPN